MSDSMSRETSTSAEVNPPPPAPDQYEYSPLSGPDDIRCLVLDCGSGDEPLSCHIRHIRLGEGAPFEAISYVWGNRVMDHNVLCNGLKLDITANLHQSLRQTRLSTRERVLWADSICINQNDNAEKGHQVRMMGRIYSQAKRVLITLGQDDLSNLHSESAASVIRQINDMVLKTLPGLDGCEDSFPYVDDNDPLLSDPRWQALDQLTAHPWFKRGWVVQEAALATEASILWGNNELNWVEFMRTYNWIRRRAPHIRSNVDIRISGLHLGFFQHRFPEEAKIFGISRQYMNHALSVLDASRHLEMDDDKDHVYAFLALPQTADLLKNLEINYKKTALDVYRDVAIWYAEKAKEPLFLHYVEHNEEALNSDFPSWIPQWHFARYDTFLIQRGNARITSHVGMDPVSSVIQGKTLQTRGLILDRVHSTSQLLSDNATLDEIASVWESFSRHRDLWAYQTFSPVLAFFETITNGCFPYGIEPGSRAARANDGAYMLRLVGGAALPDEPGLDYFQTFARDGNADRVHQSLLNQVKNRKVMLTDRGYFGLVPGVAEVGDLCGVIFGTGSPFILRSTAGDGHYKLVGEASMTSVRNLDEGSVYPLRVGTGKFTNEDWLEWGLEEQDIYLC